jgi:putative heme-binding domain-containing protein
MQGDSYQRLQVGIVAVLARSGDEESMTYLRKVWTESPERRQVVALGLAQQPGGENWTYLINTLPILEPAAAREICARLTEVDQAPGEPEPYRQVILQGLKMRKKDPDKENAAENAIGLLEYWTNEELAADESADKQLEAWQSWFAAKYPGELEARLPAVADNAKYTVEDLLEYLVDEETDGVPSRGASVYVKAQCAKCHRFQAQGEAVGPDLTTLSSRFTRKELVESIIHPSHVISSQYASKTVLTKTGRQISGLVVPGSADETVILQSNGEKVTVKADDIEATKPSKVSSMPEGLLDPLTLEEIADLFAYLEGRTRAPSLSRRPVDSEQK